MARVLVRLGLSANALTAVGLLLTLLGVGVVLAGAPQAGALVIVVGALIDAVDGPVARLRGSAGALGSFYDSVADRVADVALLGAAAWLVREDPLSFAVALVALGGAQATSYIRAKAESLGWHATVGILERAERVVILIVAFFFELVTIAVWVLAAGALITVVQRLRVVRRQALAARQSGSTSGTPRAQ